LQRVFWGASEKYAKDFKQLIRGFLIMHPSSPCEVAHGILAIEGEETTGKRLRLSSGGQRTSESAFINFGQVGPWLNA